MAPNLGLLPRSGQQRLLLRQGQQLRTPACPICALSIYTARIRPRVREDRQLGSRRCLSTSSNPRRELETTLLELQKQSPNSINLSRLQLALQGLRQNAGNEVVRVAILGLRNGSSAGETARRVLRAMLADPLQAEQPWERELEKRDESKPLIMRVGPSHQHPISLEIENRSIDEMHISSPGLDAYNIEFLLMEVDVPYSMPGETSIQALEDAVLVPTVDISSASDRISPISTPVHRALLVADGLMGAVNVSALPITETDECITAAVQFDGLSQEQLTATFDIIDTAQAQEGIDLFRQGPQNGMEYERLWFSSNIPTLLKWLKAGARASSEETTKPAVRNLIASMLQNTSSDVQLLEARALSRAPTLRKADPGVAALNTHLAGWAQNAHAELQDELDLAFKGRRWRKLGWWKLFWRVDDVGMLTNEMLNQRFMPTAEQELVYLAGRIAQMGNASPEYPQPKDTSIDSASSGTPKLSLEQSNPSELPKWPGHIAFTRRYLQNETVPALQSLAQKLVLQSLGTSGVTTSLATLLYISSFASTMYEAGAVAALGIVFSLGRLQKKWDAARSFWEGEVREEGRKAVRGAEESVAAVLEGNGLDGVLAEEAEALQKTKDLVAKAEDALARMK